MTAFYERFIDLCLEKGVSPSKAALEAGTTRAAASRWARDSVPSPATMKQLADYFNVDIRYFLDGSKTAKKEAPTETGERPTDEAVMREYMEMGLQMTSEQLKQAIAVLRAIRDNAGQA